MKTKIVVLIAAMGMLVFLIFPLHNIIKSRNLIKHGVQAEGVVTDIWMGAARGRTLKLITVSFTTSDGKSVTAQARKRQLVRKGDTVKLWYDKSDPGKIDFGDTVSYNMRGLVVAGLLFLFLAYYFFRYATEDRLISRLKKSGMKISAEFVSIDRNEKYRMGDNNPWLIKCRWTDNRSGKEYFFVSKDYTIDPAKYLEGRKNIDVYIDPDDLSKYYMDTSFMPAGNNTIG